MDASQEELLAHLVFGNRWGTLATVRDNQPLASNVAYAAGESDSFLFHISQLAWHTKNLLENPQASLSVSEVDSGEGDPQLLARVSLQGSVTAVSRDDVTYQQAQAQYLKALPEAQQLFSFADFILFRFTVEQVRFVAGFGRSFTLSGETLWRLRRAYYLNA